MGIKRSKSSWPEDENRWTPYLFFKSYIWSSLIKIILLFISVSILLGQNPMEKQMNPCSHPLIKLAREKGIKSIPVKDVLKFRRLIKECENNGNEAVVEQIYLMDWERDYKKSKTMASWTSTHAMFVITTIGYYYMAKVLDIPFDVTFFPKNE